MEVHKRTSEVGALFLWKKSLKYSDTQENRKTH